jgi:hypothetical protein
VTAESQMRVRFMESLLSKPGDRRRSDHERERDV